MAKPNFHGENCECSSCVQDLGPLLKDKLAEREATIARLREALETITRSAGHAVDLDAPRIVRGASSSTQCHPWCPLCVSRTALATPDPGRRWLEAVEQAKGALHRLEWNTEQHGGMCPACDGREESGTDVTYGGAHLGHQPDCFLAAALAALEALR